MFVNLKYQRGTLFLHGLIMEALMARLAKNMRILRSKRERCPQENVLR